MKFHEAGIPVIPLEGKRPIISNWQHWCEHEQTPEEVEAFIEQFPHANIGAPLGRWAVAIDVDSDDPVLNNAVPYSPLVRRGRHGKVAIFKTNRLASIPGREFPVEFLSSGRQIVLPPSIHPDTGEPYAWTGDESYTHAPDLPEITIEEFRKLEAICKKRGLHSKQRAKNENGEVRAFITDGNRNNRLTVIAYAMACDDVPVDEAVDRLMALDAKEHPTPWFTDPSEGHRRAPKVLATRIVEKALAKAKKNGHHRPRVEIDIDMVRPEPTPVAVLVPRPRGLMRLFQDYCNQTSRGNQDALGLGGGIALMATLCSNRFRTRLGTFDVWPNMFVLNLAASGVGKETPQRALDDLLQDTKLLGAANYKSGAAIVMGLSEQPVRLDVIDEASMLIKVMSAREDYKSEIVEVLSMLYSSSSRYFRGFASIANGKEHGSCWNPCVNILASTTPAGFKSSVTKEMATKGLLPRFIVFWQKEAGKFKRDLDLAVATATIEEMRRRVRLILAVKPGRITEQLDLTEKKTAEPRVDPVLIPLSPGAEARLMDIQEKYHDEIDSSEDESFESAFTNRFAQHVVKLALLDAVGLGLGEIGVDSVEWAYEVVLAQWRAVTGLYELAQSENEHARMVTMVYQFIRSKRGTATKSDIMRKFRGIKSFEMKAILEQLIGSDMISFINEKTGGRKVDVYGATK